MVKNICTLIAFILVAVSAYQLIRGHKKNAVKLALIAVVINNVYIITN